MSQPKPASRFQSVKQEQVLTYGPGSFAAFTPHKVQAKACTFKGKEACCVQLPPNFTAETGYIVDGPHFLYLPDIDFHDGSVELFIASGVAEGADAFARGFAGLAFRIDPGTKQTEGLYIRPTNGRAMDQVRRNHSVQYFSYPAYDFAYFRKNAPEKYEAYCDLETDTWMHMRIDVQGEQARLYMHQAEQPCLLVDDLKRGPDARGGIGLWVDVGTVAYFADIRISRWD